MQSVSTVETAAGVAVGRWNDVADLAGRIALAAIFIMSGADKLFAHTAQTVQMMEAYRCRSPGCSSTRRGSSSWPAGSRSLSASGQDKRPCSSRSSRPRFTPIFHAFWAMPADQAVLQMIEFMKNLAIFAACCTWSPAAWGVSRCSGNDAGDDTRRKTGPGDGCRPGHRQAIALALAARGARVIATDLVLPQETVSKIGRGAFGLQLDVSQEDACGEHRCKARTSVKSTSWLTTPATSRIARSTSWTCRHGAKRWPRTSTLTS